MCGCQLLFLCGGATRAAGLWATGYRAARWVGDSACGLRMDRNNTEVRGNSPVGLLSHSIRCLLGLQVFSIGASLPLVLCYRVTRQLSKNQKINSQFEFEEVAVQKGFLLVFCRIFFMVFEKECSCLVLGHSATMTRASDYGAASLATGAVLAFAVLATTANAFQQPPVAHAFRLLPGAELKQSLLDYAALHHIQAGYVATCVGSVSSATLRMATCTNPSNASHRIRKYDEPHEILSLVGTVGPDGAHFHVALSDGEGRVVGGHLMAATIFTTAEIVMHALPRTRFARVHDSATGFTELEVQPSRGGIFAPLRTLRARVASQMPWRMKRMGSLGI